MQEQLKTVCTESKGKSFSKVSTTTEELQHLMEFNASITQAAAKTIEYLTEFVFISMENLTLARRDAYLNHLKSGIKPDTVAALKTAPLHIPRRLHILRAKDSPVHMVRVGTTPMNVWTKGRTRGQIDQNRQTSMEEYWQGTIQEIQRQIFQLLITTSCSSKGSETDGHTQGYKDPLIPR